MRYALLILLFACSSNACGSKTSNDHPVQPNPTPAPAGCVKSGCSGTVCTEPGKEVVTTCEYKAEYGCYKDGVCERQPDGNCGWTQTPALQACLAHPPANAGGDTPQ